MYEEHADIFHFYLTRNIQIYDILFSVIDMRGFSEN